MWFCSGVTMNDIPVMYKANNPNFFIEEDNQALNIICSEDVVVCDDIIDTGIILQFNNDIDSNLYLWNKACQRYFPHSVVKFRVNGKMIFPKGTVLCALSFYNSNFYYKPHLIEMVK